MNTSSAMASAATSTAARVIARPVSWNRRTPRRSVRSCATFSAESTDLVPVAALQNVSTKLTASPVLRLPGRLADQFAHPVVDQREGGRRHQVLQHLQLRRHGMRVERQAIDRDQHADGGEQRQGGVEGAAGGGQRHAVGDAGGDRADQHDCASGARNGCGGSRVRRRCGRRGGESCRAASAACRGAPAFRVRGVFARR